MGVDLNLFDFNFPFFGHRFHLLTPKALLGSVLIGQYRRID
jgi:hypothetical protein